MGCHRSSQPPRFSNAGHVVFFGVLALASACGRSVILDADTGRADDPASADPDAGLAGAAGETGAGAAGTGTAGMGAAGRVAPPDGRGRCGDGRLDPGEACDGMAGPALSCADLGLGVGAVTCSASCRYDTSGCRDPMRPSPTCSDLAPSVLPAGCVEALCTCDPEAYADCDGDCQTLLACVLEECGDMRGFDCIAQRCPSAGTARALALRSCFTGAPECRVARNRCGNGRLDTGEECDGPAGQGARCEDLGFGGGSLRCDPDSCLWDTSECTACGNGRLESEERCEPGDLQGQSCQSLGFTGGNLSCDPLRCDFDTSGCALCGNGAIETGEACDGSELAGLSCDGLGLGTGTLACDPDVCLLDTRGCDMGTGPSCGNGIAERGEQCDGADLVGSDCTSLGFASGSLACNPSTCRFDTSGCEARAPAGGCGACREARCAPETEACLSDMRCVAGLGCLRERCAGNNSLGCALECFAGNLNVAVAAVNMVSCTVTECGDSC